MRSPDVVIIGGGVIGAACAYELAQSGRDVLVIERGAGWATGCSGGSAGLICPSHSSPLASPANVRAGLRYFGRRTSPFRIAPQSGLIPWLAKFLAASTPGVAVRNEALLSRLASRSLERWIELATAGAAQGLCQHGILYAFRTERGRDRAATEASHHIASGHRVDVLGAGAVRELVPTFDATITAGLYFPDEAHADPLVLTESLGRSAIAVGARIASKTAATSIRPRSSGTVEIMAGGELVRSQSVVVSAGVHTGSLVASLGVRLPLLAGRGYAVDVAGTPTFRIPVLLHEDRVVATPLLERTRLAGTLELVPASRPPDARRIGAVRAIGERLGISPGARTSAPWIGLRPCPPDGVPIIGALRGSNNVIVATGHAMLGITLAPVTAEAVRDILDSSRLSADQHALTPARFRRAVLIGTRPGSAS